MTFEERIEALRAAPVEKRKSMVLDLLYAIVQDLRKESERMPRTSDFPAPNDEA